MSKTYTKGNIIVEDIKIGDIHYEFGYGACIKTKVISLPKRTEDGLWEWKSKSVTTGEIVPYAVHEKYSHYGPNVYDNEAYLNCKMV